MTHDSIGLGEDGPTHQPVEHLAALRAIPNHAVFRPADAIETAECWQLALESHQTARRAGADAAEPAAAAHRLRRREPLRGAAPTSSSRPSGEAEVTLFATGSEVEIAVAARSSCSRPRHPDPRRLGAVLRAVRSASRGATATRSSARRRSRSAIEAAVRQGWDAVIGPDGDLRRHDRLRRQRPYRASSTSISASPPRPRQGR